MTNLSQKQSQYFRVRHEKCSIRKGDAYSFHIAQINEEGEQQDSIRINYDELLDLINLLTEFTKYH